MLVDPEAPTAVAPEWVMDPVEAVRSICELFAALTAAAAAAFAAGAAASPDP